MSTTAAAAPTEARSRFDRAALESLLESESMPNWVADRRRAAFAAFEGLALPDRRSEHWMRTDLRAFKPAAWAASPLPFAGEAPVGMLAAAIASGNAAIECLPDEACGQATSSTLAGRFASLDGHVAREDVDPALTARGVRFGAAERVLGDLAGELEPSWFSVIDSRCDYFAALHAAFHRGSAVLYVPPGVKVAEPLHVMAAITPGGVDTSHVLVVLGEGSEATLLTETAGGGAAGTAGGFHCGGTEIVVGRHALLRLVNLQNWHTGVWHV
ncbi:MAG: hypothetical protein FJ284_09165, partial [Planctomycetes bacterium]|nr:hypothetical protein [Planctomycetota bacterium]